MHIVFVCHQCATCPYAVARPIDEIVLRNLANLSKCHPYAVHRYLLAYIGSGMVLLDGHEPLPQRPLVSPPRVPPLVAAAALVLLAFLGLVPSPLPPPADLGLPISGSYGGLDICD